MPRVAFATYHKLPLLCADDQLGAVELRARGFDVVPAVWDDAAINWLQFDCVVIRSTWDYQDKPAQYEKWLRYCSINGVNLWNPSNVVRGNMNKRYLLHLAERGVEIVPTRYLPAGEVHRLRKILQGSGWNQVVVKPAISASAQGTWSTMLVTADVDQARFAAQLRTDDLLVQPLMDEVAIHGEWSLMFFAGEYSHAVLKRPAPGDFRVQEHLGGGATTAIPSSALICKARTILEKADAKLLYARVDGIERDGRFMLMELEINEPLLFLGHAPGAAQRFADAIQSFACDR